MLACCVDDDGGPLRSLPEPSFGSLASHVGGTLKVCLAFSQSAGRPNAPKIAVATVDYTDEGSRCSLQAPERCTPGIMAVRNRAMLVLTRKVGQGIVISGNILVCVLGIERGRVKIGVAAPPDTLVLREEVLDKPKPGPRKKAKA